MVKFNTGAKVIISRQMLKVHNYSPSRAGDEPLDSMM